MSHRSGPVRLLSCGIFKDEFQLLPEALRKTLAPVFLDSMLHMDPARLDGILDRFVQENGSNPVVISFGDCSPHINELGTASCVARTDGVNCCEIYLGRERYRQLRKERTFFLMPEWAKRWEHIVMDKLGLRAKELARDFMAESMSKAVYIDTGIIAVPLDELAAFSDYTGLPVSIETAGLEYYKAAVQTALQQFKTTASSTRIQETNPETGAGSGGSAHG